MAHELPPLAYGVDALEPHIDARTMTLHHDKHHAAYVEKLNAALKDLPDFQHRSATWLIVNIDQIPAVLRNAVRNNAGGHINHSLFWSAMKPGGGGEPSGDLGDAIKRDFGGVVALKREFEEAGANVFGSGWVWLVSNSGKLEITTTRGHDTPFAHGHFPILVNDVWEHAYYLKYENRRPDYLAAWWAIVDWQEAARRYSFAAQISEHSLRDETALALQD